MFRPPIHVLLNHGRPQGEQNGHLPSLEIETKHQDFLENVKLAAQF